VLCGNETPLPTSRERRLLPPTVDRHFVAAIVARRESADGLVNGVFVVGDVMVDVQRWALQQVPPILAGASRGEVRARHDSPRGEHR
jgi:hypothetical protein